MVARYWICKNSIQGYHLEGSGFASLGPKAGGFSYISSDILPAYDTGDVLFQVAGISPVQHTPPPNLIQFLTMIII